MSAALEERTTADTPIGAPEGAEQEKEHKIIKINKWKLCKLFGKGRH